MTSSLFPEDEIGRATQLILLGWWEEDGVWQHPATPGMFDLHTAVEVTERAIAGYTANKDPDWKPSEADIRWQQAHVDRMTIDPSVWRTSECEWTCYLEKKLAMLTSPEGPPREGLAERIAQVFRAMGWSVTYKGQPLKENHGETQD